MRSQFGLLLPVALFLWEPCRVYATTEEEVQSRYCCHLDQATLENMRGTHPDCPADTYRPLIRDEDKCSACPPGMCKMQVPSGNRRITAQGCLCPRDFMTQDYANGYLYLKDNCAYNYGVKWPESVGVYNPNLRSCVTTTESPTTSPTCGKVCRNNGIFNAESCSCTCLQAFRGDDCSECNENYYGSSCQNYCNPAITCRRNGQCSSDGLSCICSAERFGEDCSCDARVCAVGDLACSNNGSCNDSQCICSPGFTGCKCEHQCNDQVNCSGNGRCKLDGTCQCNLGFVGSSCESLDLSTYCSGATLTGHPCLPGLIDVLGFGFDAVRGETTESLVELQFTEGRVFSLKGTSYEIPDNVKCAQVTATDAGFFTSYFDSTQEYRRDLARGFGLAGDFQRGTNRGYFSSSGEYEKIYERSFSQKRYLFSSELKHGLYSCSFEDDQSLPIATSAIMKASSLTGDRVVERLGTHYVREATFGGKLSVFSFVESCVFRTETVQSARTEIEGTIFNLASSGNAEGNISSTSNDRCSIVQGSSYYLKSVIGGKRELLILPRATSVSDFQEWFESLQNAPGAIETNLEYMDLLMPQVTPAIVSDYVGASVPTEINLSLENGGVSECAVPTSCESTAVQKTLWLLPLLASTTGILTIITIL